MPQPKRPEPLITRVPLLGLKEYLDNYVFSSEVTQEHLNQIRQIVNKYKNFECVECANEIKTYLKSQKIKGRHIRLDTGSVSDADSNIYDDNVVLEHGEAISLNGKHEAILIEIDLELAMANGVIGVENATVNQAGQVKVVFDNHRPNGMIQESWLNRHLQKLPKPFPCWFMRAFSSGSRQL
jgi:copper chaperone CopZ